MHGGATSSKHGPSLLSLAAPDSVYPSSFLNQCEHFPSSPLLVSLDCFSVYNRTWEYRHLLTSTTKDSHSNGMPKLTNTVTYAGL